MNVKQRRQVFSDLIRGFIEREREIQRRHATHLIKVEIVKVEPMTLPENFLEDWL